MNIKEMGLTSDFASSYLTFFRIRLYTPHGIQVEGNGTQLNVQCKLQMLDEVCGGPFRRSWSMLRVGAWCDRH